MLWNLIHCNMKQKIPVHAGLFTRLHSRLQLSSIFAYEVFKNSQNPINHFANARSIIALLQQSCNKMVKLYTMPFVFCCGLSVRFAVYAPVGFTECKSVNEPPSIFNGGGAVGVSFLFSLSRCVFLSFSCKVTSVWIHHSPLCSCLFYSKKKKKVLYSVNVLPCSLKATLMSNRTAFHVNCPYHFCLWVISFKKLPWKFAVNKYTVSVNSLDTLLTAAVLLLLVPQMPGRWYQN